MRSVMPTGKQTFVIGRLVLTSDPFPKDRKTNRKLALIVNGMAYPKSEKLARMVCKVAQSLHPHTHVEFLITVGRFLKFQWPEQLMQWVDEPEQDKAIKVLEKAAEMKIMEFLHQIPSEDYRKLTRCVDYMTIGIDSKNREGRPLNPQHVELVAVVDVGKKKVVHWTGKSHPVKFQENSLIRFKDLDTHFCKLNRRRVIILGCHDLSLFNPRNVCAKGWRLKSIQDFRRKSIKFAPDVILQHPHATFNPRTWIHAWKTVERELPTVKHYASGIRYFNDKKWSVLEVVLNKTKMGSVLECVFSPTKHMIIVAGK